MRLRSIDSEQRKLELLSFAEDSIAPGTVLYTDGETSFVDIAKQLRLRHVPVVLHSSPNPAHEMLPAVHRVASLLKRWLAGTMHYGQSAEHLDYYLDEFTFRFNRRRSRSRGLLWYRLVQQAINTDPQPYDAITYNI